MPTPVREQIDLILRSIKKSQKNLKVKTSVFLKKIEELLFPNGNASAKLAFEDINLLFRGVESQEIEGLMQLCGNKGTLGGLKKSSFYAIEIVYRCLTQPKNKDEYVKVLTQSDSEEFKSMRLATHIIEKKSDTALKICAIIKEKRYHLSLTQYVYSEEAQQKFQEWFKQYEAKKKAEDKKNVHWQQDAKPQQDGQKFRQGGAPSNKVVATKKGLREVTFYEQYIPGDDPVQTLVDTFVDPVELVLMAHNPGEKVPRVKMSAKQAVGYLLLTPMANRQPGQILTVVMKLHLDSEKFDARALMNTYHQQDSKEQLKQLSKLLDYNYYQKQYARDTLHRVNFMRLCEIEALFQDMQKFFGKAQSVTEKASIGFAVRTQIKNSISKLAKSGDPVVSKFEESEKVRKLIVFLENNLEFVKLPKTFKQLQDAGDFKTISSLFKRHLRIIRSYRSNPIIRRLVDEIMAEVRNIRHKQLEKCLADLPNYEQFESGLQILIGLFEDNILEEYLLEKVQYELVKEIFAQMDKLPGTNTQLNLPMMEALPKKELIMFGEIQVINAKYFESEGDRIREWCQERRLKTNNPSEQTVGLHYSKFEKMLLKVRNFLKLYERVAAGDYDTQIVKPKKQSERQQQLVRAKTLLGDTLILWYQRLFQRVKQSKDGLQDCLLLSKMLSELIKVCDKNIGGLQDDNFREYIRLHRALLVEELSNESQPAKVDFMGNSYNDQVFRNLALLLDRLQVIGKNPLYQQKFVKSDILPFVQGIFEPAASKPRNKEQVMAFLCGIKCIQEIRPIIPFLFKFNSALNLNDQTIHKHLMELTDKHLKLAATELMKLLSGQYKDVVQRHRNGELALSALDVISDNVYLLAEYSPNCFNQLKSLMLEIFITEVAKVKAKEEQSAKFYTEVQLVQLVCNRLQSKRNTQKFADLLATAPTLTEEQKKSKDNYLLKTRHKMQSRYQSLMDY